MTVAPAKSSAEARDRLAAALRRDIFGPDTRPAAHDAHMADTEKLPGRVTPSSFYLFGYLTPADESALAAPKDDAPELKEALGESVQEDLLGEDEDDANTAAGDDEGGGVETRQRRRLTPSSMGLIVFVAPDCPYIDASIRYADYIAEPPIPDDILDGNPKSLSGDISWRRKPQVATCRISAADLKEAARLPGGKPMMLPDTASPQRKGGCLYLHVMAQPCDLPRPEKPWPKALSVTVFVVNRRAAARRFRDVSNVFQVNLALTAATPGFIGNPDMSGFERSDPDLRLHDLHYQDVLRFAGGRNTGTGFASSQKGFAATVWTDPMPCGDVEKVDQNRDLDTVTELNMQRLADLALTPDKLADTLANFPRDYAMFIAAEAAKASGIGIPRRREVAETLVANQKEAKRRMEGGIELLRSDKAAQKAFRAMNLAIRSYLANSRRIEDPSWRPFQLAFILLNLAGLSEKTHPDRKIVDLLFFPTGGGKTEAYLGLAAYQIAFRRLTNRDWLGGGVSVIMRYTLRLLTLDQLGRAAAMICALELLRRSPEWQDASGQPELGQAPIEIGLWVGSAATPNKIGGPNVDDGEPPRTAYKIVQRYRGGRGASPAPITDCPWCGAKFDKNTFQVVGKRMLIHCANLDCDFSGEKGGLPVLAVDEEIYNRLPAFIVATVDKFAALPRRGEVGRFFDHVDRIDDAKTLQALRYYGADEPGAGFLLDDQAACLPPPDLIIQDELHLISGPLGTVAGLYEAAIDRLSSRNINGELRGPKIIASTATVRRADDQIKKLFGRSKTAIFPPPGIDRRFSYFARTRPASEVEPRRYIGVSALGIGPRKVFLRTVTPLLAAAQREFDLSAETGERNPADPYMTALCYFNALRELGGTRRIVEGEVAPDLLNWPARRLRDGEMETASPFAKRQIGTPREITSRDSTEMVAEAKARLAKSFHKKPQKGDDQPLDIVLATNMISVGLDITRLGLMIVQNQPKSAAEYIQATSRVGRDEQRPGLILVILNMHRARDRAHYEDFQTYHEAFYRAVEATSVTPESARAQDRALGPVFAALVRHLDRQFTPAKGASRFRRDAAAVIEARRFIEDRLAGSSAHIDRLIEGWEAILQDKASEPLHWDTHRADDAGLMHDPLRDLSALRDDFKLYEAAWSMRDVQPAIELDITEYLERPQ